MDVSAAWTTVVLAGAATFAMRASFLAVAHRFAEVPHRVQRVLRQIPPAALASLVLPALLRPEGHFDLTHPRAIAGVIAGLVAWKTRNVAATLVVGMAVLVALQAI